MKNSSGSSGTPTTRRKVSAKWACSAVAKSGLDGLTRPARTSAASNSGVRSPGLPCPSGAELKNIVMSRYSVPSRASRSRHPSPASRSTTMFSRSPVTCAFSAATGSVAASRGPCTSVDTTSRTVSCCAVMLGLPPSWRTVAHHLPTKITTERLRRATFFSQHRLREKDFLFTQVGPAAGFELGNNPIEWLELHSGRRRGNPGRPLPIERLTDPITKVIRSPAPHETESPRRRSSRDPESDQESARHPNPTPSPPLHQPATSVRAGQSAETGRSSKNPRASSSSSGMAARSAKTRSAWCG